MKFLVVAFVFSGLLSGHQATSTTDSCTPLKPMSEVSPLYPESLKGKAGEERIVVVKFTVNEHGNFKKSSNHSNHSC